MMSDQTIHTHHMNWRWRCLIALPAFVIIPVAIGFLTALCGVPQLTLGQRIFHSWDVLLSSLLILWTFSLWPFGAEIARGR